MRLSREYPNISGFPVDPRELDLPKTMLDTDSQYNFNNHHMMWTFRTMALSGLSLACRNLARHQIVLPKDIHNIIHDRYDPAPVPDPTDMMDVLDEARQRNELLRFGSANNPTYKTISDGLWRSLNAEYNALNVDGKVLL